MENLLKVPPKIKPKKRTIVQSQPNEKLRNENIYEIRKMVDSKISDKLKGKPFDVKSIQIWSKEVADDICESIVNDFLTPDYKYIVQLTIGQRTGAGCCYDTKCFWDSSKDFMIEHKFMSNAMYCVCNVFGILTYN